MSFLAPKAPTPPPAPNTPVVANATTINQNNIALAPAAASLINTSSQGLTSKANTQKVSLLGGSS